MTAAALWPMEYPEVDAVGALLHCKRVVGFSSGRLARISPYNGAQFPLHLAQLLVRPETHLHMRKAHSSPLEQQQPLLTIDLLASRQ